MHREADSATLPRLVLFLDGSNYYRGRFCEEYFNHSASRLSAWRGISRALRPSPAALSPGPIAPFALARLRQCGIRAASSTRLPLEVTDFDFRLSDLVIGLDEREHRPMVESGWRAFAGSVQYWQVPAADELAPSAAFRRLERALDALLCQLANRRGLFDPIRVRAVS